MTGPEHYRKAEELLSLAADYDKDYANPSAARCRQEALVHATLAAAAATAAAAGSAASVIGARRSVNDWIKTVTHTFPADNE